MLGQMSKYISTFFSRILSFFLKLKAKLTIKNISRLWTLGKPDTKHAKTRRRAVTMIDNLSFSHYRKIFVYALFVKVNVLLKPVSTLYSQAVSASTILFKPSDLSSNYLNSFSVFSTVKPLHLFLRKNKLFNKGRYSRNRQVYRTGAYWCLWVNILAVSGFYYWFYRFTMNFGYLWPFFSLFILSFIIPRALKYNYIYANNLVSSLIKLLTWFYLIFLNVLSFFLTSIKNFFFTVNLVKKLSSDTEVKNQKLGYKLLNYFYNVFVSPIYYVQAVYFHFGYKIIDTSDLLLKTYSHWNYFLPIKWIHKDHRLFFYKRLYAIFFV